MELSFVREEIPKIARAGGSGREAEPWENHLAPLKDTPEVSFRVWDYEKRGSAVSRMSSVRERLSRAVPGENWQLAVRPIPGQEPVRFGVYISYIGEFTDEQIAQNAKKHQERSERVKASRKAAQAKREAESANGSGGEAEAGGGESTETAKERVTKAREAQKAAK